MVVNTCWISHAKEAHIGSVQALSHHESVSDSASGAMAIYIVSSSTNENFCRSNFHAHSHS